MLHNFPSFLQLFCFRSNNVIKLSENLDGGLGTPDWRLTLCLLLGWTIIFLVLARGV